MLQVVFRFVSKDSNNDGRIYKDPRLELLLIDTAGDALEKELGRCFQHGTRPDEKDRKRNVSSITQCVCLLIRLSSLNTRLYIS